MLCIVMFSRVGLGYVRNLCSLGNTGLSKHAGPVFLHFCSLNQNLARVRTGGGGGGLRNLFKTTKRYPKSQQHQHVELQLHQHFDIHIDHSCSLHKATNHISYWIGTEKNDGSKKGPKVRKHGVAVSGQARVRTNGEGGECMHQPLFPRPPAYILVAL